MRAAWCEVGEERRHNAQVGHWFAGVGGVRVRAAGIVRAVTMGQVRATVDAVVVWRCFAPTDGASGHADLISGTRERNPPADGTRAVRLCYAKRRPVVNTFACSLSSCGTISGRVTRGAQCRGGLSHIACHLRVTSPIGTSR